MKNTEDRRIRPDPERQCQHGYGGKTGILHNLADGVLEVLEDCVHKSNSTLTGDSFTTRSQRTPGGETSEGASKAYEATNILGRPAISAARPPGPPLVSRASSSNQTRLP